nr:immunoglobulin heavy chain junction region [Macaca mulatta]
CARQGGSTESPLEYFEFW